jgi:O-antigen/teichoic acid export membrane protein
MRVTTGRADGPPEFEKVDRGEAPPNLTGTVVRGAKWKAANHVVAEGSRVVVAVILARLLTPADYGLAGMALVVTSFAAMFSDPSLGPALIQRPTITERDRSTVFWTSLVLGVALTLAGVAASGLVADFFGEPQVKDMFIVTSLCFVLVSLSVTPRSLLVRRLAYRSLEIREMISRVIGGITAVILAFAGFGPWAVVSNFVATTIASALLLWLLAGWRPRLTYSFESLGYLGSFGLKNSAAGIISWSSSNLDNVLVGRVLGPASLGYYALAYNVMYLPAVRIGRPLGDLLSPAYSRIQSDRVRLERSWLRGKRMVVLLVAPGFLAIFVAAPDLIEVAFGSQWEASVVLLRLLCLAGVARSLSMLNWGVLQATGKGGSLLRLSLLTAVVTWIGLGVGLMWGVVGVAAGVAVARWLMVLPEAWITSRAVGFPLWPTFLAGGAIIPIGVAAAAVALGARELLLADVAPIVRLLLELAVMGGVYVLLVVVILPSLVADIRSTLRQRSAAMPATS